MLPCEINVTKMNVESELAVKQYLVETIGIRAGFAEWSAARQIPYAIRAGYDFSTMTLLGHELIAISPKDSETFSPAKLAKHLAWLNEHYHRDGVFISKGLEAYNRKRLIEKKVPFIVPGNQIYLPDLGIDFREHLRSVRKKRLKLSPSAQMVLLGKLLNRFTSETWTATVLADFFQSTKVTMGRAIDELENQDLIEIKTEGREKQVHFKMKGRDLWEKAKPILHSPVLKHVFVENIDLQAGTKAGLQALSEKTMLAAPARQIRALNQKEWGILQKDVNLRIIPNASSDMAPIELEIWKYDPRLLGEKGQVDPLSLYLSLVGSDDERVEGALDQLLEKTPW